MSLSERFNEAKEKYNDYSPKNEVWTITFGECVENHTGMQTIGEKSNKGFSADEVKSAYEVATANGFNCELIYLNEALPEDEKAEDAYILIVRNGISMFFDNEEKNVKEFNKEVYATKDIVDKKAFMKGRVVNKKARYNLCYAEASQLPDYENKKGTIVSFKDTPCLQKIREKLPELLGEKAKELMAELNYYYDVKKCYIGYHGDTERSRVIGIRVGSNFSLKYNWYKKCKPIGKEIKFMLSNGDFYVMSDKAVGMDWKRRVVCTLRHAAGMDKD